MTTALFLWAIVGGLVGAAIGSRKGRPEAGFLFGLLLGPIGWLIVVVGPDLLPKGPTCPHCGGEMIAGKAVCRHCGRDVPIPAAEEPLAASKVATDWRPCPHCGKEIARDVIRCQFCWKRVPFL